MQTFFFNMVKLIQYLASAVIVVLVLHQELKYFFYITNYCLFYKLLFTLKLITFLPKSKFEIKTSVHESNPTPYPK